MVEEIAVEVDIVLGDAAQPREAVRVDGMDQNDPRVRRKRGSFGEKADLDRRSRESFHAVGARVDQQNACGVARAEQRDIGRQRSVTARRRRCRVDMILQCRPRRARRVTKFLARRPVVGQECR